MGGCAAGSRFFHTPGRPKQFLIIYRGGLAAAVTPLSLLNGKNRARAWWSGLKVSIHLKRPPRLEEQSFAWRAHPCPRLTVPPTARACTRLYSPQIPTTKRAEGQSS